MADVVINITGNTDGLRSALNNVPNTTTAPAGGDASVTPPANTPPPTPTQPQTTPPVSPTGTGGGSAPTAPTTPPTSTGGGGGTPTPTPQPTPPPSTTGGAAAPSGGGGGTPTSQPTPSTPPPTGGGGDGRGGATLPPRAGVVTPDTSSPAATTAAPTSGTGGSPSGTAGDTPAMPTYERMAQDIRREMQSRGVLMVPGSTNYSQFITTIRQQEQTSAYEAIDERYAQKRDEALAQYQEEEQTKVAELDDWYKGKIAGQPQWIVDNWTQRYNERRDRLSEDIDTRRTATLAQLQTDSEAEKRQADRDLERAIKDLTQELKTGAATSSNSYLGQLRQQRREAIARREAATDEEGARTASQEIAEIDRRIAAAMGRGGAATPTNRGLTMGQIGGAWSGITAVAGIGLNAYGAYLRNTGAEIEELRTAANGNAFSALQQDYERRRANVTAWGAGIGGVVGGVGGGVLGAAGTAGFGTGAGIVGGTALGTGIGTWIANAGFQALHGQEANEIKFGQLWADQERRLNQFTQLAMMLRGNERGIEETRTTLLGEVPSWTSRSGVSIYDLGYTASQASQMTAGRIAARGFINNYNPGMALDADALERQYNMSVGSLNSLASYDRYGRGNNAIQAFSNLVASLDTRGTLGMSGGQRLRSGEFLGYQTQLMEMQKAWMNPNDEFATRQLLAAQNAFGNNLDTRAISEIGQINNAITRPQEGAARMMTYDVVQQLFPETRGNLLAIQQKLYSENPEDRARIQQAVMQRIGETYGDVNTTSGFLAYSAYTGIDNPERLRRHIEQLNQGLPQVTRGSVEAQTEGMEEYTPAVSKQMLELQDKEAQQINEHLSLLNGVASKMLDTFQEQLNKIIRELGN